MHVPSSHAVPVEPQNDAQYPPGAGAHTSPAAQLPWIVSRASHELPRAAFSTSGEAGDIIVSVDGPLGGGFGAAGAGAGAGAGEGFGGAEHATTNAITNARIDVITLEPRARDLTASRGP
jgi:hypothetical protein